MLKDAEQMEFDIPLDEETDDVIEPADRTQIFTDQGDPEVESLYNKCKRGKLIVQPDFQRQFVWDTAKCSRLIESALLDIPLPIVYISQEKDNKEYVIDGQQRLTSFFSFLEGKFPSGSDFRLSGLKVFSELNQLKFSDLPEHHQDKIRYCKIRTITFRKESNPNLKFEIFERLNTGSVSLNDQELRNCIYRGTYNELLKELAFDQDFRFLLGISKPDKRMRDVQLVLRFSAFYHETYLKYKSPMRLFMNRDMEKYQSISDNDAAQLRMAFKNSVSIIKSLLGKYAFKRYYKGSESNPNGNWEPNHFNASLYDVLMYSFAREEKHGVFRNLDAIREALIFLMTSDPEFIDSIEISTSTTQAVTKRFDKWRLILQQIVGIQHKEPRCFSFELKQKMFHENPICEICRQKILSIDDSSLDHIEQFWRGGKTVPENARLTHRFCNSSRPRNEFPVREKETFNAALQQVDIEIWQKTRSACISAAAPKALDVKPMITRRRVPTSEPNDDYTNKKLSSCVFLGKSYRPKNWMEMLLIVASELYYRHSTDFAKCLGLRGWKITYFGTDPRQLKDPKQISDSEYYVTAKLSTKAIVKISRDLIGLFGYSGTDLHIESE